MKHACYCSWDPTLIGLVPRGRCSTTFDNTAAAKKMRSNVSFVCGPPSNPCMKYAFFISSIIDNKEDPSMLENSVQHCKKTRQSQDLQRNEEALESAAMQRAKKVHDDALSIPLASVRLHTTLMAIYTWK